MSGLASFFAFDVGLFVEASFGPNGTSALSRITALLIAALAVSFMVTGITDIVKTVL